MPNVRAQRWLTLGMLLMLAFLVALVTLHVWEFLAPPTEYEPGARVLGAREPRHISAYALGPAAPVWLAGVAALALGMMSFAIGLRRLMPRVQNSAASCWLLFAAGATMIFLDVFPTDPTPLPSTLPGALHDVAAIASLTLQCMAMVLLTQSGNVDPTWQRVVGSTPAWAAVAACLSIGWGLLDILPAPFWEFGAVVQRAVAVFMVYWMLMVGWRVRWLATADARNASSLPS